MPLYEYRCRSCHNLVHEFTNTELPNCPLCDSPTKRVFGFYIKADTQEHFNNATGKWTTNMRAFKDDLKSQSDDMSQRMGFDVDYEPVEYGDKEGHGVTEEGLDETRRVNFDARQ